MADTDITPPTDTQFEPAPALAGATLEIDETSAEGGTLGRKAADARQTIVEGAGKLTQQATDKARMFAEDGKAKAGGALDQLSQLLTDAAANVDEKLGDQYGQYARTAAGAVSNFSDTIKNKDIDALVDDARSFVKKSPAIAVGAAAALGFVLARLIQSGADADKA